MKTPKKKEVVKYFENAKEIESLQSFKFEGVNELFYSSDAWFCYDKEFKSREIWSPEQGYAKILSYKEPKEKTYKITREQVLKYNMKDEFPEVFENKLTNDFTGWVLDEKYPKVIAYSENGFLKYGFDADGNWIEGTNTNLLNERKATEKEVEEALIKECERLGIKEGAYIKCLGTKKIIKINGSFRYYHYNCLKYLRHILFCNGKFAEVVPTLISQEAEEKLNCKIV